MLDSEHDERDKCEQSRIETKATLEERENTNVYGGEKPHAMEYLIEVHCCAADSHLNEERECLIERMQVE